MSSEEMKSGILENFRRIKFSSLLLWVLVTASILLNVIVLNQLNSLRRAARESITEASMILADLQDETITLMIPVNETITLDTDFPVNKTVTVPIQTEVPISSAVTVNVDAGVLGGIPVSFPIYTTVPVDISVDVPIEETFNVHAPVTLDLEIPVELAVADTPLYETLGQFQEALDAQASHLEGGVLTRE